MEQHLGPKPVGGTIVQPKKPNTIEEAVKKLGEKTFVAIKDYLAQRYGVSDIEIEGRLNNGSLAIQEEPIGNGKSEISVYERVDSFVLKALVDVEIEKD